MNELKTISDRIEYRRIELGLRKSDISKGIGLDTPQTFSNWISRNSVPKQYLIPLSEFLGVRVQWLQDGAGEMLSHSGDAVVAPLKDHIEIIQHNDVSGAMGNGVVLSDQPGQITGLQVTMEWADKNIPANTGNKNLRVVTGFGDSMKGMFNSGDPLLVDIGVKSVKYDAVYFFRVGDEGYIKRLQRVPGDGIIVISNNPEYRDWTIKTDMDFEVFGRVLKVWEGKDL